VHCEAVYALVHTHVCPLVYTRVCRRDKIEVYGLAGVGYCLQQFFGMMGEEKQDVLAAYKDHGGDCGEMVVEEGLVDLDLGKSKYKEEMKAFYNKYMGTAGCTTPECTNSDLSEHVDTTSWLKNAAW